MDIDKSKWPFSFRHPILHFFLVMAGWLFGTWLVVRYTETHGWVSVGVVLILLQSLWHHQKLSEQVGRQLERLSERYLEELSNDVSFLRLRSLSDEDLADPETEFGSIVSEMRRNLTYIRARMEEQQSDEDN